MIQEPLIGAIVTLIILPFGAASAQEGEEPNPDINYLAQYLSEMSDKLDFYVTFEDRPNAEGTFPWLNHLKDGFTPDLDVATIDALVAKLDQELEGVKVRRSAAYPSVVHFIAEDLLAEGYLLDEHVNIQYSGVARSLPDHIGTLLDGKIKSPTGFPIGASVDLTTEVEVNVQDKTVRDVLSGAVPLVPTRRFLWVSRHRDVSGTPKVEAYYYAPDEEEAGGEE